ncbi:MAG: hypothetical protein C0404_05255 [Verrucomicrobia bacterium]|nr:hypothetical protein [Verrucomicrobiota bacterium]
MCGAADVEAYGGRGVTHLLSIDAPGYQTPTPRWLKGPHKHVFFQDILSEDDAVVLGRKAPSLEDVQAILDFGSDCIREGGQHEVHLLVHCAQGASRSPAAAFAIMALALGPGHEKEALDYVMTRRRLAIPNRLVVRLADKLLDRKGKMVVALAPVLKAANDAIDEWLNKMKETR